MKLRKLDVNAKLGLLSVALIIGFAEGCQVFNSPCALGDPACNPAITALISLHSADCMNAGEYQKLILSDSTLVGYWRFAETTGTTAVDESGAFNGTYNGGATLTATGLFGEAGGAVEFDGTSGYMQVSSVVSTATDNWTVELWYKSSGQIAPQLLAYNGATAADGWGITDISGNVRILFGGTSNFDSNLATPTTWTHYMGVRDSGSVRLYMNGSEIGITQSGPGTVNTPATANFSVGANEVPGSFAQGTFDEVAVYERVLTEGDARVHYQGGSCYSSL